MIMEAGEHHPPCHQGRGWHLVGLVMLQMSGCARLYPAVLSTFLQARSVNRSELSLSALFSILSPLKTFSLLFWVSENVTASMLLLCYYTGNEILFMEKSQSKRRYSSIWVNTAWNKNLKLSLTLFFSLKANLELWLHSLFWQFLNWTKINLATTLCIFFLRSNT